MERITNSNKNYCEWSYCCKRDKGECGGEQGAGCVVFHLYEWLKYYEDLAEQGMLMKLPVPEGTEVWKIAYQRRGDEIYYYGIEPCMFKLVLLERFGDTVFKTKAEAEARLAELEER